MENCLVKKLKATVNNDSLKRLGEITLKTFASNSAISAETNQIKILSSGEITVRVMSGDGYLVDSDLTSNPVKSKTIAAGNHNVYFTNHDMILGVGDASLLRGISAADGTTESVIKNWEIDFDEFKFYKDLFTYLVLPGVRIRGDIVNLYNCYAGGVGITQWYIGGSTIGAAGYNNLYGNLDDILLISPDKPAIPNFSYSKVTGNLTSFINANSAKLHDNDRFTYTNTTCNLSELNEDCYRILGSGVPTGNQTYPTTRNTQYLLCVYGVNLGDRAEAFVLDMANKPMHPNYIGTKIFNLYGTVDVTKQTVLDAIAAIKTTINEPVTINGVVY